MNTDVIGAEMWNGEYVCDKCGRFIADNGATEVIGFFTQMDCHGEIRVCRKCGNTIQMTYGRKGRRRAG